MIVGKVCFSRRCETTSFFQRARTNSNIKCLRAECLKNIYFRFAEFLSTQNRKIKNGNFDSNNVNKFTVRDLNITK